MCRSFLRAGVGGLSARRVDGWVVAKSRRGSDVGALEASQPRAEYSRRPHHVACQLGSSESKWARLPGVAGGKARQASPFRNGARRRRVAERLALDPAQPSAQGQTRTALCVKGEKGSSEASSDAEACSSAGGEAH